MPDIVQLCDQIKAIDDSYHITIETAATVFKPLKLDLASLSPKLSNSTPTDARYAEMHERQRLNVDVIQQFIDTSPAFQLKFVMSSERDMIEIEELLKQIHGWKPDDVLLMPEGTDAATLDSRAGWIAETCKRTGYRYCPRLHVALYGNKRGT